MWSVGQRATNLLAIKLWEWFDPGTTRTRADWFECGRGRMADFFLRPPTLKASNFAALQSTDPIFTKSKDLNPLKKHIKNQEASSILKLVFAPSKWPHLHRACLLSSRLNWPALYHCHGYYLISDASNIRPALFLFNVLCCSNGFNIFPPLSIQNCLDIFRLFSNTFGSLLLLCYELLSPFHLNL